MELSEVGARDERSERAREGRRALLAGYSVLVLLLLILPVARFLLGHMSLAGLMGRVLAFVLVLGLHCLLARPALRSRDPLRWRSGVFLWLGVPVLLALLWEFLDQT